MLVIGGVYWFTSSTIEEKLVDWNAEEEALYDVWAQQRQLKKLVFLPSHSAYFYFLPSYKCRVELKTKYCTVKEIAEKENWGEPFLTLYLTSRNDAYGGEQSRRRMQISLDMISYGLHVNPRNIELIIVEWNPLPGAEPLHKVLSIPCNIKRVRFIQAPPSLHDDLVQKVWSYWTPYRRWVAKPSDIPPIFEFYAKNIAIRRIESKYMMGTNMDDVFSPEVWEMLSLENLDKSNARHPKIWRMIREKAAKKFDPEMGIRLDNIVGTLLHSVYKIEGPDVKEFLISDIDVDLQRELYWARLSGYKRAVRRFWIGEAQGDFWLVPSDIMQSQKGYFEFPTYGHWDSVMLYLSWRNGMRPEVLLPPARMIHQKHGGGLAGRSDRGLATTNYNFWNQQPNPNSECWGYAHLSFQSHRYAWGEYQGEETLPPIISDPEVVKQCQLHDAATLAKNHELL